MEKKLSCESPSLKEFICSIHPADPKVTDYLEQHSLPRKIGKGKHLLKPGEACNYYFYIRKGLVRAYIKDGNKEVTTWICREGDIVTSIRGINERIPLQEYIQAIEPCELIMVHYDVIAYLYEHFNDMNTIGRKILEKYYADAEERALICRIQNASKRYQRYVHTQPFLINRVPIRYIASFLGIAMETLSRIRSRRREAKHLL